MKTEIAEYIEVLLASGKSLSDAQARAIAYWEFVDFQAGADEPDKICRDAINKLLKGIS